MIPALIASFEDGLTKCSRQETDRMLIKLALVYPNVRLNDAEAGERMEAYHDMLKDIPRDILSNAFLSAGQTCTFFPSIAEIRKLAAPELAKRQAPINALKTLALKHDKEYVAPPPEAELVKPDKLERLQKRLARRFPSHRDDKQPMPPNEASTA